MAEQELTPSVQSEPLPGRPYPRLPESVSPQDEGSSIGDALQQSSQIQAQQELHADRTRALDADNTRASWVNSTLYDPQNGLMNLQGKNAVNLAPQFLEQYDKQTQTQAASLANDQQRQMFLQKSADDRPLYEAQLMKHESEQMNAYSDQTAGARIATAQQTAALNFNDPQIIAKSLQDTDLALETTAQRKGWAPEELQQQQQAHFSALHMGVLGAMLDHDRLPEAQAYLDKVRPLLAPDQASKADEWISQGQVTAAAHTISAAYAQDAVQGAHAMAGLQKSDLTQDQQVAVIKQVDQAKSALSTERRQQYQKPLMALEEAIAAGKPPDDAKDQIENLWHKGVYTDEQASSAMGRLDKEKVKDDEGIASTDAANYAFQNHIPIDPHDKDAKADVDEGFRQMVGATQPGTPEYANRAVSWAERTGIIPESSMSWARASLVSGDPKSAAQAADFIAKIGESTPGALSPAWGDDKKTPAIAAAINAAVRAGTPGPQAVEMARKNADLGDADRALLDERWKTAIKVGGNQDRNQSNALISRLQADPTFKPAAGWLTWPKPAVPAIPPAMQADFDSLSKSYYRYTQGNVDQARDLAARDLKHVWGVSEVNGARQIMPYAPESMFPGLTTDVIRNDIAKTVADNAAALPKGLDASKVQLIPDAQRTARTGGREWNLGAPDEFGMRDVLRDANGTKLAYTLPVSAEDYGAAKQRIAQEQVAKARVLQGQLQQQRSMEQSRTPGRLPFGAGGTSAVAPATAAKGGATPEQQAWLDRQVKQDVTVQ